MQVHAQWLADVDSVTGYEQTGCASSMFANRLSWFYNFKGPSKIVDTGAERKPFAAESCGFRMARSKLIDMQGDMLPIL